MWEGVAGVFGSVVDAAKDVLVAREGTRAQQTVAADSANMRMAEYLQSLEFRRLIVAVLVIGSAVLLIRRGV